jgi:hypothetical protein
MKIRTRTALAQAIERGIDWGYSRAHKYTDTPDESRIKESIETEIWNEIDEIAIIEDQRSLTDWIHFVIDSVMDACSRTKRIGGNHE